MTRILILLLCLSVGYGQSGITLEQLEKTLKASEERTKIQIENLRLELKNDLENLRLELKGDIKELNGKIEGMKFVINAIMVGVTIIIAFFGLPHVARILGKREIIRVENGYRDEAKMQANAIDRAEIQAMIEKALKEQAQVQKVG